MQKIELSAMESNDLIRLLNYAKDKKREEMKIGKITVKQFEMECESIRKIFLKIPKSYKSKSLIEIL